MYGRCETDPFDQATDVCDSCYGEFCPACLVTTKGRKHPICTGCTIVLSGIRPGAKPLLRGSRKSADQRRRALKQMPVAGVAFEYFDEVTTPNPKEPEPPERVEAPRPQEPPERSERSERASKQGQPERREPPELPTIDDEPRPLALEPQGPDEEEPTFHRPRPFMAGIGGRRRTDPPPMSSPDLPPVQTPDATGVAAPRRDPASLPRRRSKLRPGQPDG